MKVTPAQQNMFADIEAKIAAHPCVCGGDVTIKNNLMMCSKCGYGASVKIPRMKLPELER